MRNNLIDFWDLIGEARRNRYKHAFFFCLLLEDIVLVLGEYKWDFIIYFLEPFASDLRISNLLHIKNE